MEKKEPKWSELEKRMSQYAPLATKKQIQHTMRFVKQEVESIISQYMKALGDEKLSVSAWKRIADLNRDLTK